MYSILSIVLAILAVKAWPTTSVSVMKPAGVHRPNRGLNLRPRSSVSYSTVDPAGIALWLRERGYRVVPSRNINELIRVRRGQSLIVVYHSGSVLLQGIDLDAAHHL